MNIQAEKLELIKLLLNTDNPVIINSIRQIFRKNVTPEFWDELTPTQKQEIKQGLQEVEAGETVDYEMFISNHR